MNEEECNTGVKLMSQWFLCYILNCIDYLVTKAYLNKVGDFGEGNPIQHYNLVHYGSLSMLGLKIGLLFMLFILILVVREKAHKWITSALMFANMVIGSVIVWGFYCLWSAT